METNTRLSATSIELIKAVKAEAARRDVSTPELAKRTNRDRKFFYDRFSFRLPFSTDDIDAIAKALGITAADIINSARFAAEIENQKAVA